MGSVRLLLSWHERAASAGSPLALLPAPSHIGLVTLDGAFEAGAAVGCLQCRVGLDACMRLYGRVRVDELREGVGSPFINFDL